MHRAVRRVLIEVVGWSLVAAGIAALILPGPGLLMLAAGLVVLSQQYEWAARRLEPVKRRALAGAATSVESWPRIAGTVLGVVGLGVFAALWLARPDAPTWWPVAERWWLPGGAATGVTLALSAVIAAGLLVWSYRTFHGDPERIAAASGQDADRAGAPGR